MSYDIFTAAEKNDIVRIKQLLASGTDVNAEDFDRSSTALHWACAKGNFQAMEVLIDAGADVNKVNKNGRASIHNLVSGRFDKLAVWLVKRGADPNLPDKKGFSAIDLALPFLQKDLREAWEKRGQETDDDEIDELPTAKKIEQKSSTLSNSGNRTISSEEEIMKVHLRNGSYKSVKVTHKDNCESVCELVTEKCNLPPGFGKYFELYEKVKDNERRLGGKDNLFEVKKQWPMIFGPSGNETHLKCYFIAALKPGAPEKVQQVYKAILK